MFLAQIIQFLTLVLAPLYIIRFPLFSLSLNSQAVRIFSTNLLEVLLFLSFIVTFYYFAKDGYPFKMLKTKLDFLILLFLLVATFETLISFDPVGGAGILKAYFVEPILFYYCLIYQSRKSGYFYIILGLLLSGLWLSLLSLLQLLTNSYTLAPYEMALGRVSAVYNSANSLALYLGPIVLLSFGRFLIYKQNYQKMLLLTLFIFFTAVMIWTKSRGGLVGEAISLVILGYGLLSLKSRLLKKAWIIVPIILAVVVSLFFYQLFINYKTLPKDSTQLSESGDTLQIRYKLWSNTATLLQRYPLTGAGLNGFQTLYKSSFSQVEAGELFQYPHNIFLNFWIELGISGLVIFLLIQLKVFSNLLENIYQKKEPILGLSLLGMLIFWLMHGLVDVPYFKNDLSLEFWTVLALVQIYTKNS